MDEPTILDQAKDMESLISSISFGEDSIQLDYTQKSRQRDNLFRGEIMLLPMDSDERQEYYYALQELLNMIIRDESSAALND